MGAALLFGLTTPILKLFIPVYDLLPVAGLLSVGAGLDLGFFQISGNVLFVASLLAGFLWAQFGPAATVLAGAGVTAMAFVGLV